MPIDVGRFTTEVTVTDGELPLSAGQLERVVRAVMQRLEEQKRAEAAAKAATAVRGSAVGP